MRNQNKNDQFAGAGEVITDLGIAASSIDVNAIADHIIPNQVRDEIPTLNQFGYMKFEFEEFSKEFFELAKKAKKPVLEIGPAYGWVTHQVLKAGAEIVAADISKEHLEVLVKTAPQDHLDNLHVVQGAFPQELDFPEDSFDAILISRVLHFLEGDDIELGLQKVHKWLAPGGKFIATNCSIYHQCVREKMLTTFQKRIEQGEKWPGIVRSDKDIETVHADFSPGVINVFHEKQLNDLLPMHKFKVDKIGLFDYPSDPWDDKDKGHIGFVATKI